MSPMVRRCAVLATGLLAGAASAESTYGTGNGANVRATARLALSVEVPKLIVLRVGAAGAGQTTVTWNVNASIPGPPAVAPVTGNNQAFNWGATTPTFATAVAGANAVQVRAYTNALGATLSCTAPTWNTAGGPPNANFTVTSTGAALTHPGANLGACGSRTIARGAVRASTWTYNLSNAGAVGWRAGTYTATVTYTATAP